MFKKVAWPTMLILTITMTLIFVFGFVRVATITSNGNDAANVNTENNSDEVSESADQEERLNDDKNEGDGESERGGEFESDEVSINGGSNESDSDKDVILILGDSIGAGLGDERNLGIGERFVQRKDFEVSDSLEVVNFSVPGAETDELEDLVLGNEIDGAIMKAKYVFISIGGNNLNRMRNVDATMKVIEFEERLADHLDSLDNAMKHLRGLNQDAAIVVLGLYNPYGEASDAEDIRFLHEWNHQTGLEILKVEGANMIHLYDVFDNHLNRYLSLDQFHPSGDGYEKIAELIDDVLADE